MRVIIVHNGFKCILVSHGSSVNILFGSIYEKILMDHDLTPMSEPSLYGFTRNSIISWERITLAVEMSALPIVAHYFMEFHLPWSVRQTYFKRS